MFVLSDSLVLMLLVYHVTKPNVIRGKEGGPPFAITFSYKTTVSLLGFRKKFYFTTSGTFWWAQPNLTQAILTWSKSHRVRGAVQRGQTGFQDLSGRVSTSGVFESEKNRFVFLFLIEYKISDIKSKTWKPKSEKIKNFIKVSISLSTNIWF